MKFRDIAKMHAYNRGLKDDMTTADMEHYLKQIGDGDSVTPGRLDKANAALDQLRESLATKWDLGKKFRNTPHPVAEVADEENTGD